jgi:ATP-dependent RNA helicase TDRD9
LNIRETAPQARQLLQKDISRAGGKVVLRGPWSAYEVGFVGCTFTGKLHPARIERDSVNSITLNDEPCTSRIDSFLLGMGSARMMVASNVTLNAQSNTITARDTTLMPSITGLLALTVLAFCPAAELRADPSKSRYIGALCGLGWDVTSPNADSAFPDHDIEITFDFQFEIDDLKMINSVREAVNLAVCMYGETAMVKIQQHARHNLLNLIQKRREPMKPIPFRHPYRWCQVDPADICVPVTHDSTDHVKLYQMHCGIALRSSDDVSLTDGQSDDVAASGQMSIADKLAHQSWLQSRASRSMEPEEIHCRLCNKMLHSPNELLIHLSSLMHRRCQPVN